MISANGGLPAHRYTPQVTPRWPRGSEPASVPSGRRQPRRMAQKSQQPPASAGGFIFLKNFVAGTKSKDRFLRGHSRRSGGPMGKLGHAEVRREYCGGSSPAVALFSRLGGLARSQISAPIGARQAGDLI